MAKIQGNIGAVQGVYNDTGGFLGLSLPSTPGDGVDVTLGVLSLDVNNNPIGIVNPKGGLFATQTRALKPNAWRVMKAVIGAPAWTTIASSAVLRGMVVKLVTGELIVCVITGTAAASEPLMTNSGVIVDNTVTWIKLGRVSNVDTGVQIPTISSVVSQGAGLNINTNFNVNTTLLSKQVYYAGGLNLTWLHDSVGYRFIDGSSNQTAPAQWEFFSDAIGLYLAVQVTNGRSRVYVDYLDGAGYRMLEENPTVLPNAYMKILWTSRAMKKYKVVSGVASEGIYGITTDSGIDTISTGNLAKQKAKRLLWLSDSYGNTRVPDTSVAELKYNQEQTLYNIVGEGIGCQYSYGLPSAGGGYVAVGNGTILTMLTLNPITEVQIDYVIIAAGFNDRSSATATVSAVCLLAWQKARSLYPYATIIIVTAWQDRDSSTFTTANEAAYLSQFAAWNDANSVLIQPMSSEAFKWVSGSGYTGTTNGSGNSDFYISTDSTHPSPNGVTYFADKLITSIIAATN